MRTPPCTPGRHACPAHSLCRGATAGGAGFLPGRSEQLRLRLASVTSTLAQEGKYQKWVAQADRAEAPPRSRHQRYASAPTRLPPQPPRLPATPQSRTDTHGTGHRRAELQGNTTSTGVTSKGRRPSHLLLAPASPSPPPTVRRKAPPPIPRTSAMRRGPSSKSASRCSRVAKACGRGAGR